MKERSIIRKKIILSFQGWFLIIAIVGFLIITAFVISRLGTAIGNYRPQHWLKVFVFLNYLYILILFPHITP